MKLGIQLFSLRNEMIKDPVKTIEKTLDMGYCYLEPANGRANEDAGIGYDVPADQLSALLKQHNGSICSAHVGPLSVEAMPAIVQYHKSVGNRNIVEAIQFYTSYDHLMRRCEEYNAIGKYLVENGMNPLLYHNHYHEFQPVAGKEILYHIMEQTDPNYVQFELDTGWVKRAGRDPLAEMDHMGSRLKTIHIKDFAHTPANLLIGKDELISWDTFGANHQEGDAMKPEDFVEIGTGMMNLQEIIDKANQHHVTYAILEQDDTARDIFDSIQDSLCNLKKYKGLEIE